MPDISRERTPLSRLWNASPPLTATGLLMAGLLAGSLVGLWLDSRTITGAPAWLKPSKFHASVAIYTLTLAWIFALLPRWGRMRRWVGITSALVFLVEIAIIDLQVWRGTTSHFNTSTALDGTLFSIMGLGILVQTLSSVAVAVALWRETLDDRLVGWALRLGLVITIVGASAGGLMTRPTAAQLAAMQDGPPATVGAHTVGAPDGGPGLPGTNWSLSHGDLRVSHFLGLHAMQALPLLAFGIRRRRLTDRAEVALIQVAAASYGTLFLLLLWQALRGQSVLAPDTVTMIALAVWAGVTSLSVVLAARRTTARVSAQHAVVS